MNCSCFQNVFDVFLCNFMWFQNTLILRAIPGLNEIGKALLGNAIQLSETNFCECFVLIGDILVIMM